MKKPMAIMSLLVLLAALASPVLAQDAPRPYVQISHFTVKPGMTGQFESIIKEFVDAAGKTGAPNRWNVFQVGAGGSSNHYHLVATFNAWAERDRWMTPRDMYVAAHGEKAYTEFSRRWTQAVTEVRTTLERDDPTLSSSLEPDGGLRKHYLVSVSEVRPEKLNEFRLATRKLRAGQDKTTGSPYRIARRVVEGNRYTFKTISGFDSGADRDRWPTFSKFMSMYSEEETAQILDMLNSSRVTNDWYEVTHRADLSFTGNAPTSN